MLTSAMPLSGRFRVSVSVRIRFGVCLVSGYAHVFILLSAVTVTLRYAGDETIGRLLRIGNNYYSPHEFMRTCTIHSGT